MWSSVCLTDISQSVLLTRWMINYARRETSRSRLIVQIHWLVIQKFDSLDLVVRLLRTDDRPVCRWLLYASRSTLCSFVSPLRVMRTVILELQRGLIRVRTDIALFDLFAFTFARSWHVFPFLVLIFTCPVLMICVHTISVHVFALIFLDLVHHVLIGIFMDDPPANDI